MTVYAWTIKVTTRQNVQRVTTLDELRENEPVRRAEGPSCQLTDG
jgi:hypothetical protein